MFIHDLENSLKLQKNFTLLAFCNRSNKKFSDEIKKQSQKTEKNYYYKFLRCLLLLITPVRK